MEVPRYNRGAQLDSIPGLFEEVGAILRSGDYVLGPRVERFEEELAAYLGTSDAVGVNSGTDALVIALRALGIGPGDEVVTVANTFHATVLAITRVGATPRLVDCRPDSWLIDLGALAEAIGERTRAIVVVHLFGRAVDMDAVLEIARPHGLAIVEDCAQAVGAKWRGRRVGSYGDAGCFSFHPSKNLFAAGDGGAIAISDPALAERCRQLRNLGQGAQNDHRVRGYNSKLDEIQAAILLRQLPLLDGWNASRREAARAYDERLRGTAVTPTPLVRGEEHVYHLLQVAVEERDRTLARLRRSGVDAVVRYPVPVHRQAAFADLLAAPGGFPVAERQASSTLCLPIRPDLSPAEVEHVCNVLTATDAPTPVR
jgi:dTDP-4-amino-4,6-dideoxygalactose transaminase